MDKDRDLTITEFLDTLQREYLVAEIRHKIYSKISDKRFWEKVMEGKRQKIEDICFRNKIDSIFSQEKEKRRLYEEIYNEKGLPNFSYKDDTQRYGDGEYPGLEQTDIENYYSEGSEVRVDYINSSGKGERFFGKITGKELNRSTIFVESEGAEYECHKNDVTRIL